MVSHRVKVTLCMRYTLGSLLSVRHIHHMYVVLYKIDDLYFSRDRKLLIP